MAISRTFRNLTKSSPGATPVSSVTSASFDSTGARSLVVWVKHEAAPTTITVSDNKGNTFSAISGSKQNHSNGDLSSEMFVDLTASVGTGHTVTANFAGARPYVRVVVWTITADAEPQLASNAQAQGLSSTFDAGTLTIAGSVASVSMMGVGEYSAITYTPGSGWTEDVDDLVHGQSRADAALGTIDPVATGSGSMNFVCQAASFIESGGVVLRSRTLVGVGL